MTNDKSAEVLATLETRAQVRDEGSGWRTRCPSPDHEDAHPSFLLYPDGGGTCFSQCNKSWSAIDLRRLLGIEDVRSFAGLTVSELAAAKGLDIDLLRSFGLTEGRVGSGVSRLNCVDIPYADTVGNVVANRKRLALHGPNKFRWRRGDKPIPYGLSRLKDAHDSGWILLVEGESDCWALWSNGIPAIGLPGAGTWKAEYAKHLQGMDVFVWQEPDSGGSTLRNSVCRDIPQAKVVIPPEGFKDPSELLVQDAENFLDRISGLMKSASTWSENRREVDDQAAEIALSKSMPILRSPNVFKLLDAAISSSGYAGDTRPALIAFVGLTSRLLDQPLKLAYISPSGAGKNAAVDAVKPFFPENAYYLVSAASPRALIYCEESFNHRVVIFAEADSIPEDGPAASAIRSLMSDPEMRYETVEKVNGKFETRRIHKPGPTGVITTSTNPLPHQACTRTLTVPIPDTPDQTRRVLHAQAKRRNGEISAPEYDQWLYMQEWLSLAGRRKVYIPFAEVLADLLPTGSVRMRRDFDQLLTVIQTCAVIHQLNREQDANGRIIATIEDYRSARWLLEEIFSTTVNDGASTAIRKTVEAVGRLGSNGPVSQKQLAAELGLSTATISYRVKNALRLNLLVNQANGKGSRHQLVLGDPLPDGHALPTVEEVQVCVASGEIDSNVRTDDSASCSSEFEIPDSVGFEPSSKGDSNLNTNSSEREFEEFESFQGIMTHATSYRPAQDREFSSTDSETSIDADSFGYEETF